MTEYLLDTNAINKALDQEIEPGRLRALGALFVTHIQIDELRATRRLARQQELLGALQSIDPARVSTAAAVWDVSEWGHAEFGDGNGVYQPLLQALIARNGGKANNVQDALIGVTAIARCMTLVTDDADLAAAVHGLGGRSLSFEAYLASPPAVTG